MGDKAWKPRKLSEGRTITLPPEIYQPPTAKCGKEHCTLGASLKAVRRAFFRPVNVRREGP